MVRFLRSGSWKVGRLQWLHDPITVPSCFARLRKPWRSWWPIAALEKNIRQDMFMEAFKISLLSATKCQNARHKAITAAMQCGIQHHDQTFKTSQEAFRSLPNDHHNCNFSFKNVVAMLLNLTLSRCMWRRQSQAASTVSGNNGVCPFLQLFFFLLNMQQTLPWYWSNHFHHLTVIISSQSEHNVREEGRAREEGLHLSARCSRHIKVTKWGDIVITDDHGKIMIILTVTVRTLR